jgi:hypothetical protein
MPPEYNFRAEELHLAAGNVKLIHKHHRTSIRRNAASLGMFLNISDEIRLYIPDGKMVNFNSNGVVYSDIEDGVLDVLGLNNISASCMDVVFKISEWEDQ